MSTADIAAVILAAGLSLFVLLRQPQRRPAAQNLSEVPT